VRDRYSKHDGEMRDRNGYELNTASTIAALLYGRGDFVETLRIAFNYGWDADNNAATGGTIIGVIRGRRWMDAQGWDIADRYHNVTRDAMPEDETIKGFGRRLVFVARRVIGEAGGHTINRDGNQTLVVRNPEGDGQRTLPGPRRPVLRIPVESPANVEPLTHAEARAEALRRALRQELRAGLDGERVGRARAAYLAIGLDEHGALRRERPDAWHDALAALETYPDIVKAIFTAPKPSGDALQARASAAGLSPPENQTP
jgi:hypothetical protein